MMKQIIYFVLFVLKFQIVLGQIATIQDPDGWTNVREAPNRNAKIIHKVFENNFFFWNKYEEANNSQWIQVSVSKNIYTLGTCLNGYNAPIVGYIHKSRILILDSLVEYKGHGFSFKYNIAPFDSTGRIVDKLKGKWPIAFDGRPIWGTDGTWPITQVNSLEVNLSDQNIQIHPIFFKDIFECTNKFRVFKNKDCYIIYQWNSDGAGWYEIVWVFDKNGLKQRLIGSII